MLLTKTVKISPRGSTLKRYQSLGYSCKYGDIINVKVEDLPRYSPVLVQVSCDYCGEVCEMSYADYLRSMGKIIPKYACRKCVGLERKESVQLIYGVDNIAQLPAIQNKIQNTNIERYGVYTTLLDETTQNKIKQTCKERYGVEHACDALEIQAKRKQTMMERYGVEVPFHNLDIYQKAKNTLKERYGIENPLQNSEFHAQQIKTMSEHGKVKTSKQQIYLYELFGGILNFPVISYSMDILYDNFLDIEYDGGGHDLRVKHQTISEEQAKYEEIIRNEQIKRQGYKVMRIKSLKDYLPSDEILLQMLADTKRYFIDYPNHSWVEYYIDEGVMKNAENKNGTSYDYGELRKIKKIS